MIAPKPARMRVDAAAIPVELRELRQWVVWRWTWNEAKRKWDKPPLQVNGYAAKTNDSTTWTTFSDALSGVESGRFDGVGFVFTEDDPFVGVDLDGCRDAESGGIQPWAQHIIEQLGSYAEISPSGTGVHVLCRGVLPSGRRRKGSIEMYSDGRFFTVTGRRVPETRKTIEERTEALASVWRETFGEERHEPLIEDDDVLLEMARRAKNGQKFAALYDGGDTSAYDGDESRADAALCGMLAFWTGGDELRIERLFSRSTLGQRAKWTDRADYRSRTIRAALEGRTEFYDSETSSSQKRRIKVAPTVESDPCRPEIVVTTDIEKVVDAAEDALLSSRFEIFQRAGALVRITTAEQIATDGIGRDVGTPVISEIPIPRLREMMAASGRWHKLTADGELQDVLPPEYIANTLAARGEWRFPTLRAVVTTPTLREDGSILSEPGYDHPTGLFLASCETFEPIPDAPTRNDAQNACKSLLDPFCDFPFRQDCDRAATLAALLTHFAIPAVSGPIPLFAATAPVAGSGKSMLVDGISIIATGEVAPRMADSREEEEMRKRIFSLAEAGDPLVLIDNIERPFASAVLCAAITGRRVRDRVLGKSIVRTVPLNWVCYATGNNLRFRGDLVRRVIPIRLDPRMDNPEARTGFRYPNLGDYLRRERPRLVRDTLVILRSFVVAGRPRSIAPTYGSFEAWDKMIRHAVVWVMGVDPLAGRDELKTDDSERDALVTMLMAWQDAFGSGKAHAKAVNDALNEGGTNLRNALSAICNVDSERLHARSVGTALGRYKDRIVRVDTNTRLVLRKDERGTAGFRWFIETVPM